MSSIQPEISVGDIGVILECTITKIDPNDSTQRIAVDLSNADTVEIEVEKPDGSRLSPLAATIKNSPGTDGIITHTDSTGIWDVTNRWKARGIVTFVGGNKFHGTWQGFNVSD